MRTALAARVKHVMGAAFVADYFTVTCGGHPVDPGRPVLAGAER
ncbi:hypothetical protein ACFWBI_39505 [Streptomyces sp. NPDC059982]